MYAVIGITGQVGGKVARYLLRANAKLRAIVRDEGKAATWKWQGVELARADLTNAAQLKAALEGVDGAFVMLPPNFAPAPDFREARAMIAVLSEALQAAHTPKVVALSSIGAQQPRGLGLITQLHLLEAALSRHDASITCIRAGWFMENAAWDVAPAHETGELQSFLHPLDRPVPMVATADVARVAANALLGDCTGRRPIEVAGPRSYSPIDLAAALGRALDRSVEPVAVPRERWEALFRAQGTADPAPRIEMLDGFNSGWIGFGVPGTDHVAGCTELDEVVRQLVHASLATPHARVVGEVDRTQGHRPV